jgi:IS4 transposase
MNSGRTVFAQLFDFLPKHEFNKCVQRYRGHRRLRKFSCLDQLLAMAFAQLTYRDSLRDIETCLRAMSTNLYHAGFRSKVSRSTLADANERRDWRIYGDFAHVLIAQARKLYADDAFAVNLDQPAYAFDSTTIDLCLSLFPWAKFRKRKGAVKLHTLIDLHGNIPCFIHITDGKTNDVKALDQLVIEPSAFYMMDRGYIDFRRLYRFTENLAFFVIRAKRNMDWARRSYRRVDKSTGLRSDQTIVLRGVKTSLDYPVPLRRISYHDAETDKRFVFLTNNFQLPALTIPQLYQCRWQVELFFKWIKQHLRIKSFYGTSSNAVRTQVWISISVYVLVAIVKKELKLDRSLSEILQILSITLFEKTLLSTVLTACGEQKEKTPSHKQLSLFDF